MYSDFMRLLEDIETNSEVTEWKIDDIHIWPIVRFNLFFAGVSIKRKSSQEISEQRKTEIKLCQMLSQLKGIGKDWGMAQQQKVDRHIKGLGNAEFVFLSQTSNRNTQINQLWYDRICNPYIDLLKDFGKRSCLLECTPFHLYRMPRYGDSLLIQKDINNCKIQGKIFLRRKAIDEISSLSGFASFQQRIHSSSITSYSVTASKLAAQIASIKIMSQYFKNVLDTLKPLVGFTVPYYWDVGMAFNLACRSYGINCVDIQHGVQNPLHPAYASWHSVPVNGYKLLPSHFLCWSQYEVQLINQWRETQTKEHEPVAIGNLGLLAGARDKESCHIGDLNERINSLRHRSFSTADDQGNAPVQILLTLQPFDHLFPSWFLESIKALPQHWLWWVRLHPAMISQREKIYEFMDSQALDNVEVRLATESPLPRLLTKMDVHLTQSSSVVLEAADFGIPSVLTDPLALDLYPMQVDAGLVVLAESTEALRDAIALQLEKKQHLQSREPVTLDSDVPEVRKLSNTMNLQAVKKILLSLAH